MTATAPSISNSTSRSVVVWLVLVWAMILAMVLLGGITRLTGSGLSMVDWHPLMGALPPSGEAQWNDVFEQYQQSPQYVKVNQWMDLEAFKQIFFWEYLHRLVGRLIGVVVLLPCIVFALRRKMSKSLFWKSMLAILLGGLQGMLGWFMVKSGLVDEPRVSHLRLASHLVLAMLVGQWILWMLLDLHFAHQKRSQISKGLRLSLWGFFALILLQITYGAFVAGLRAGHMAMTFPDMNGYYLPHHFFTSDGLWENLFHNPLAIHFVHRTLGLLILLAGIFLYQAIRKSSAGSSSSLLQAGKASLLLIAVQVGLGIWTLLSFISIPIAVAHQGTAFLLLGGAVAMLHRSRASQAT